MAGKALMLAALVTAQGDPVGQPIAAEFVSLAACEAQAKATVEALALLFEERTGPIRLQSAPVAGVREESGVWVVGFQRQSRSDPKVGEPMVSRNVRGVCREIGN